MPGWFYNLLTQARADPDQLWTFSIVGSGAANQEDWPFGGLTQYNLVVGSGKLKYIARLEILDKGVHGRGVPEEFYTETFSGQFPIWSDGQVEPVDNPDQPPTEWQHGLAVGEGQLGALQVTIGLANPTSDQVPIDQAQPFMRLDPPDGPESWTALYAGFNADTGVVALYDPGTGQAFGTWCEEWWSLVMNAWPAEP